MNVDTTHNGGPRLAQELLDLTLDHLHYDIKSLKQSALVSKSLLPTCQRHLFSTFRITEKLAKLFASPSPTDGDDEDDDLRDRIVDLLDAYTTHLILTDDPRLVSAFGEKKAYLPEFKNVQKITFKGDELPSAVTIPSFLVQTWMSPSSRLRTVEFDFRSMGQNGILESLYLLPAAVENVSFTCTGEVEGTRYHSTAASIRSTIRHRFPPEVYRPGVHQISGTLKLRLVPMFNDLLPVMLELKDLFKFGLKWINCRITSRQNIGTLASLVDQCEDTLQFLDIPISSLHYWGSSGRSFDFSRHRALRHVRIWTPTNFEPKWLCTALSTIPIASTTNPRVPSLRIELHVSLPHWMMYPDSRLAAVERVDEIVTPWIAVDSQLSRLIGLNPDTPSATSVTDGATTGILLDITVPGLTTGPAKGVAALMFPLLSSVRGLVRLV